MLGFVWVFLKPFLIFLVLLTIFSIFRQDIPHYQLYLLLGIVLFQFFADGTLFGMNSVLDKRHLVLKLPFPRFLAVLASTLGALIHLFFALILFGGFLLFAQVTPSFAGWGVFFILLVSQFFWILGISFFTSLFVIRFRDLGQIWEVFLTAMFYLVPIFYPLSIVPEHIRVILWANPLAKVIVWSRNALLFDTFPEVEKILLLLVLGILWSVVGFFFFQSRIQKFTENI